jgi:hypothetical protein
MVATAFDRIDIEIEEGVALEITEIKRGGERLTMIVDPARFG